MPRIRLHTIYSFVLCVLFLCTLIGCANRGIGPQGGPKDSIPPIPLHSDPEVGALNFKGKRIEVTFNEYLQLSDVAGNLMMSPPQQTPPDVKARGKKLIVQFQDTLRDSTTYTLDFGDAVCDYHEQIPLHGFSFYFSTGDEIDTLETRGRVFDAETLNPAKGVLVGIHSDKSDTAFTSFPFLRIAKTDSAGYFRIGNIHQGTYRIYAVDDMSRDYRLTVGEALAFTDELITPVAPPAPVLSFDSIHALDSIQALDSIARLDSLATVEPLTADSLPPDSLRQDTITNEPSAVSNQPSVTLFLFSEKKQKVYLQRTSRDMQHMIQLAFSAPPDSALTWRVLRPSERDSALSDSAWTDPTPYIYEYYSPRLDTLTLWLTDSIAIAQDSLFLEARYRRTDSVYNFEWYVDTLRAVWRAPKMTAKMKEALERKNRNRRLDLKTNARRDFEIYDTLRLSCTTPLAVIEPDSIHLVKRSEENETAVPFTIAPYDTLPTQLIFIADLQPGENYELRLDSGALQDIYGVTHIAGNYPLNVKTPADYSTLRVKLIPFEPLARIQILDNSDQVIRELPAVPEGAFFEYLKPDGYYMRLYLDLNGDGQWTAGSWEQKRQPEPVYYFPQKIQTKSNWDFDEEWDYKSVEQTQSKPKELLKASSSGKGRKGN